MEEIFSQNKWHVEDTDPLLCRHVWRTMRNAVKEMWEAGREVARDRLYNVNVKNSMVFFIRKLRKFDRTG